MTTSTQSSGSPQRVSSITAPSAPQDRIEEAPTLSRFDVQIHAAGSFQPGKPIRIIATVQSNLNSPRTQLRIVAPEAAAAEMYGWGPEFHVPVGTPLPTLGNWTYRLAARQRVQQTAELIVRAPGLYSVLVSAYDPSEPLAVEAAGRRVQKLDYAEVWVEVTDRGGRVLAHYDPTLIPAEMLSESGPFRRKARPASAGARTSRASGAVAYSTVPGTASADRYQALYGLVVGGSETIRPLPDANVMVRYYDASESVVDMVMPTTDAQGYFSVPCRSSTWSRYEVVVMLQNDKVVMGSPTQYPAGSGTRIWCGSSPGVKQARYPGAELSPWIFENMVVAADRTLAVFGERRSQIRVRVEYDVTNTSYYDANSDAIAIDDADAMGTTGAFTTAHEYGHAFHHKALGGLGSNACPKPHRLAGAHSLRCAYTEGFANYLAAATRTETRYQFQANDYYPATSGAGDWYDGSIIEGPVAAFLLDLSDEYPDFYPEEPFDQVTVPAAMVADLYRSCEVRTWLGWQRADGIDHLIYCLEGAVDPALYAQGYFLSRGSPPPEVRMSSAFARPNLNELRSLWIKNLYDPTRQPGSGGTSPTDPTDPGPGDGTCVVDVYGQQVCTDA